MTKLHNTGNLPQSTRVAGTIYSFLPGETQEIGDLTTPHDTIPERHVVEKILGDLGHLGLQVYQEPPAEEIPNPPAVETPPPVPPLPDNVVPGDQT